MAVMETVAKVSLTWQKAARPGETQEIWITGNEAKKHR
jgi:hypothetical protein